MSSKLATQMTKRGLKRSEEMIKVAVDVFIEHGYEGATLDMVIERSGGSRSTLYNSFGGKEGLFIAVIETCIQSIFADEKADIEQSIQGVLTHYGQLFLQYILDEKTINIYRLMIAESSRFPELGHSFYQNGPEKTYHFLADKLACLPELQHCSAEFLLDSAALFLEMSKAEIYMQALCLPDFQLDTELMLKRLETSVLATEFILLAHKQ